jgi:hypothetical protein
MDRQKIVHEAMSLLLCKDGFPVRMGTMKPARFCAQNRGQTAQACIAMPIAILKTTERKYMPRRSSMTPAQDDVQYIVHCLDSLHCTLAFRRPEIVNSGRIQRLIVPDAHGRQRRRRRFEITSVTVPFTVFVLTWMQLTTASLYCQGSRPVWSVLGRYTRCVRLRQRRGRPSLM